MVLTEYTAVKNAGISTQNFAPEGSTYNKKKESPKNSEKVR